MGPIEHDVPHEYRNRGPNGRYEVKNALSIRMQTMDVGDSFIADSTTELYLAKHWQRTLRPDKRFSIIKEPYLGWRVWRIE